MTDVSRTMLKFSIACLCVAAAIAIVALLTGDFDETEGKVTVTTLWVALYNITGMGAAAARPRRGLAALGICGFIASAIGFALGVYLIWSEFDDDGLARAWGIATTAAISIAQAALLLIHRRPSDSHVIRLVRTATIVVVVVLAALIMVALASAEDDPDESFFRILGALAVLDALGTLSLPILRRLQPAAPPPPTRGPQRGGDLARALGLEQDSSAQGRLFVIPAGTLDQRLHAAGEAGAEVVERGTLAGGGTFALLRAPDGSSIGLVEPAG